MKKIAILSVVLILGLLMSTHAQTPVVKERQKVQHQRIKQGIKNHTLTKAETLQLVRQHKDIRQTKRRAKADGVVSKHEKSVIQHKQNKANRNIYRKKHNIQGRK